MLSIETVVPETGIRQEDVTRLFAGQPGMTRLGSRLVRSAFDGAGVATRHTVLPELAEAAARASHAPNAGPANSRVTSSCRMTVSGTTVSIDSMRTVMRHGRHRGRGSGHPPGRAGGLTSRGRSGR